MTCYIKWGDKRSRTFKIPLGIKQGGINSPEFFSCYVDEIIHLMKQNKVGCHIRQLFLAIILFADDMCLLAPTRSSLQKLIDKSASFCQKKGLNFSPKKSKVLIFSKKKVDTEKLKPILLNGGEVEYVTSIKYLGVSIECN